VPRRPAAPARARWPLRLALPSCRVLHVARRRRPLWAGQQMLIRSSGRTNRAPPLTGSYNRSLRPRPPRAPSIAPTRHDRVLSAELVDLLGEVPPEALLDRPPDDDLVLRPTLRQMRSETAARRRQRGLSWARRGGGRGGRAARRRRGARPGDHARARRDDRRGSAGRRGGPARRRRPRREHDCGGLPRPGVSRALLSTSSRGTVGSAPQAGKGAALKRVGLLLVISVMAVAGPGWDVWVSS
jgi:hypothetical protein